MKLDVFLLSSLGCDVALDFLFAPSAADCADVVAVGPEFSAPEVLLNLRHPGEYLSGGNALDGPHDLRRTVWRYRLDKEMNVIFVGTNFEKCNIIPVGYLQTDRFEDLIHFRGEDCPSVLCRTDQMVEQDRHVETPMDMLAHASEYTIRKARQAAGNLP